VGLLGLQMKMHPFFGIFEIKSLTFFSRFMVLKNEIFAPQSFVADSY
jgi:hypothetical protein